MKLLVMGAGYVGSALLVSLQKRSHEIFITTTRKERVDELKEYGQVLLINSTEDKELKELINTCDGMVVLVAPKNSQNYENTYLNTAKRITSALEGRKTPFYILYTSSTSVCEGIEQKCVTEDTILTPRSDNAKILLETEQCYLNCGVETCVLRLGGIYGPKRDLIDRARRFSGKELPGTGDEPTNHIHLDDIVAAIDFCLEHRLTGLYHLVNDDHTPRNELYSQLCNSIGIPSPHWNPNLLSQDRKKGYIVSNQKIKEMGFRFRNPFTNAS